VQITWDGRTHVRSRGLLDEDVEGSARDVLGIERIDHRLLVDEAAAGAVDQAHAFFILAIAAASMMFLVFSVSGVCRVMKSAALQEIVEIDLLDADVLGALRRQERIERESPSCAGRARGRRRSSRCCRSRRRRAPCR